MNKRHLNNFAIIGAGMVGTAIGFLLRKAGYKIIAIADKSPAARKRALLYMKGETFLKSREAVQKADCILITTPDDVISSACKDIALCPAIKGKLVFHMSGAGGLDLLDAAKKAGAAVASVHPLQSFSSIDQAIKNIPGSYFAITADKKAQATARNIVRDLKGIPLLISSDQKPLYHAAACLASNYLVSLMNTVESIYKSIGLNEKDAKAAYLPLVYGSLKNIENSGSIPSLTGPIARGDFGTIKKHIKAINKNMPQYSSLYSSLGLITVKVAQQKGTLNARQVKTMNAILKGAINHEQSK
ncbi:MAG: DUF2520 domain-containing protein [Deltaproteobacteria bacterium]|nr:DUF2520 domain-containing protein [Deltaproteobacteria bacterium]